MKPLVDGISDAINRAGEGSHEDGDGQMQCIPASFVVIPGQPQGAEGSTGHRDSKWLEAHYPRVKEEDRAEEQELPRVVSVQFNISTPSSMGMGLEERQTLEAGPFSRATKPQIGGTSDRRTYKASVVSPVLRRKL